MSMTGPKPFLYACVTAIDCSLQTHNKMQICRLLSIFAIDKPRAVCLIMAMLDAIILRPILYFVAQPNSEILTFILNAQYY